MICVRCNNSIPDSARFCNTCGAEVQEVQIASTPTVVLSKEQQFRSARLEPIGPKSSGSMRTAKIVTVATLVVLVLVALGGLGFRTLFGARDEARTSEQPPVANESTAPVGGTVNPAPSLAPSVNTPTPVVVNTSLLTAEVDALLNSWAGAARAHNLDLQMTFYTDVVSPYFGRRSASRAEIRADRAVAYRRYSQLDIQLSDIRILIDSTGTQATATFDKSFTFSSADRSFSGAVNTRLWLTKFGAQWLITGEKDLKVYSTR